MHMKDGDYADDVAFDRKEYGVREITNECPPSAFFNYHELKGIFDQSRENRTDLRLETEAEVGTLPLVPKRRLEDFELRLG